MQELDCACYLLQGEENEEPFQRFNKIKQGWDKENASRVESMQEELFGHTLLAPEELNMEVLRTAGTRREVEDELEEEEDSATADEGDAAEGEMAEEENVPAHIISEEEFMSVSNIVRGRCKREECNELLELIIAKTRKVRGTGAPSLLTTAALVSVGARVTGQTGGSRLATLRSLKRIAISKDGITLNAKYLNK